MWNLSRNKVQLCRHSPDWLELWYFYLLMIWCNWSGVKSSNVLSCSCYPLQISQGLSFPLLFCAHSGPDISWVILHIIVWLDVPKCQITWPRDIKNMKKPCLNWPTIIHTPKNEWVLKWFGCCEPEHSDFLSPVLPWFKLSWFMIK